MRVERWRLVAAFAPMRVMQSLGAVQATGVQQELAVKGFVPLARVPASQIVPGGAIALDLLPSEAGVRPFLNGQNHVVFQDGEPATATLIGP